MDTGYVEYVGAISKNPLAQIARLSGEGSRVVVGYLCNYVPEELLYAAGLLPVRLLGHCSRIVRADRHLPTYCCSHIRGFLEDFLANRYQGLKGCIFGHTCDTMQGFGDLFRLNNPELFVHNFNFPTQITGEASLEYARREMVSLRRAVEDFSGSSVSPDSLKESVGICNTTRRLLSDLYDLHAAHPSEISSAALLDSVLASMWTDKRDFNVQLSGFLASRALFGADTLKKRLILVGSVNLNRELYAWVEEYGATVVDDDLCTGRRYFDCMVGRPDMDGILERYFNKAQCPAKHRTLSSRAEYLRQLARKHRAHGVLFVHLKFCDPHAFDFPHLREALEKDGVRSHLIEMEQIQSSNDHLRTQIQAFVETIGGE